MAIEVKMRPEEGTKTILPQQLDDGLVMRRPTAEDTEALVHLSATTPTGTVCKAPDDRIAAWTRDLLTRPHPTFTSDDCILVKDTRSGEIVSIVLLIPQTWSYAGVLFGVGRPEMVCTHPDYRNRGLIRAQLDVLHEWSLRRGDFAQAITGIPFFYQQFGYEMALSLGGGRGTHSLAVPALPEGTAERFRLRPAQAEDAGYLAEVEGVAARRYLVTCVRDAGIWRYEIGGKSDKSWARLELRIIVETASGECAGYLGFDPRFWDEWEDARLTVCLLELNEGRSWLDVVPSLLRGLVVEGQALAAGAGRSLGGLEFALGLEHPFYQAARTRLATERKPYAYYLRVPDVPRFVRHVAPVLERRLGRSVATGYSGEMKLSFYKSGLKLTLCDGHLGGVQAWQPSNEDLGAAAFPGRSFLQALFGYRDVADLSRISPECWVENDETWALLLALFPRQPSDVWAVS